MNGQYSVLKLGTGGAICCSFLVFGGLSILPYKPWRRRIDRSRQIHQQPQQIQDYGERIDVEHDHPLPLPASIPDGGATADEQHEPQPPLSQKKHP